MRYYIFSLLFFLLSCSQHSTTIKLKGSDTEVNLSVQMAESFHSVNPAIFISISGGGSGLGIASLLNGTADLANSSRSINTKEIELFQKRNIIIDSFVFAQDAIAFVVAEDLPLDSVATDELAHILDGTYTNWHLLTGKYLPINIYGRQSNSGTYDFVKAKLSIEFSPHAKEMNGNAQILEAIKTDHSGIGYVGAGYVPHGGAKGIKILSVFSKQNKKAVSPLDRQMIAEGKYYFQRPLFQYFKTDSYEKIKPIIDFEKSYRGKQIIKAAGYYPVK